MKVVPLTLAQANELVTLLHRHHKPAQGHRFSLGAEVDGLLVGAVIVGRPVGRNVEQYKIAEITRLVTDGTKNACSFLYSAAARVARAMGFEAIQTYILAEESGVSLRAANWSFVSLSRGSFWNKGASSRAGTRRTDQPNGPKQLWIRRF